ncbi:hypothetical protein [Solibacillus daqui]|uniref:hypothetical protein n=1 Tax=Solibacillus daqui TaxID=2912187 RepID=UPI0023666A13|nr:hypothetical protein [Solibacillus daqui]
MELLQNERLLENPVSLETKRMEKLLSLLDSFKMNHSQLFTKEDACLITYDIWTLLELGGDYEEKINNGDVNKKNWRLFLLNFFAANGLDKDSVYTQYDCTEKRFFTALFIVKKLISGHLSQLEKLWKVQEHSETIQLMNSNDSKLEILQQRLFTEIQNKWYIHLFKYKTEFQNILVQVERQQNAVEQILGPEIWKTIDENHFAMLMKSIESNHFAELHFWKEKIEKTEFVTNQSNQNCSYILCVQQDVSMREYINIQTAIVLQLIKSIQKNEQNFIFVPFAQTIEREMVALKGMFNMDRYYDLNQQILIKNEPINYKNALNYALLMLKLELSQNENGKIYFLCNEMIYKHLPQDEEWKNAVESHKKNNSIQICVIYLGGKNNFKPIWFADEIHLAEQFVASVKV